MPEFTGTNLEIAISDPRPPFNRREKIVLAIIATGVTLAFWVVLNDEIVRGIV